jgi:hypothetical protein
MQEIMGGGRGRRAGAEQGRGRRRVSGGIREEDPRADGDRHQPDDDAGYG